ncbi:hypothetical protein AAT19DRAFT_10779 [Rhodotorula toruloides]|uniref:F-box domain-containing protein n=1 Tax=Rhodotorula toruloides TaxID=5286 RepID=A0A2S9ZY00_RHOTO|nr:hypothetical protein AAT19DRAFT_10779 [Rhodotorula toruloides]
MTRKRRNGKAKRAPAPRLPAELVEYIVGFLDPSERPRCLARLSRVSRHFRKTTQWLLYERICIRFEDVEEHRGANWPYEGKKREKWDSSPLWRLGASSVKCLATLRDSFSLAEMVRRVDMKGPGEAKRHFFGQPTSTSFWMRWTPLLHACSGSRCLYGSSRRPDTPLPVAITSSNCRRKCPTFRSWTGEAASRSMLIRQPCLITGRNMPLGGPVFRPPACTISPSQTSADFIPLLPLQSPISPCTINSQVQTLFSCANMWHEVSSTSLWISIATHLFPRRTSWHWDLRMPRCPLSPS